MYESRQISKKKIQAKRLVALAFCAVAPFSASAQTAIQPSKALPKNATVAKIQPTFVIRQDGIARNRNDLEASLEDVDFPDSNINPKRFGDPVITVPKISGVPDGTRTYSQEEIYGLIATESQKIGVDPQFTYIIADIESRFRQFAVSETGAIGVMQLMPGTAADLGIVNSYDAAQNIRGGVSYLKQLLNEFGNPIMAAAAYHSGPQAARDANGIPKGPRTAKYIVRILNDYYGIANSNFNPSSAGSVKTAKSVKNRPAKRQAAAAVKPRASAKPVQEGKPEAWDAGFVLHLE